MDLLAGYGSGSDASDTDVPSPSPATPQTKPQLQQSHRPSGLLSGLPPPCSSAANGGGGRISYGGGGIGGGGSALFKALPAPQAGRKVIPLALPLSAAAYAKDSDVEEDRPKKKLKPSGKGLSLADVLPAPKHDLGFSSSFGAGLDAPQRKPAAASPQAPRPAPATATNDAYRVDSSAASGAAGAAPGPALYGPQMGGAQGYDAYAAYGDAAQYTDYPQQSGGAYQQQSYGPARPPAGAQAQGGGEAMLAAALAAEAQRAQHRTAQAKDPFADLGVKFVEVKQAELKYVDPTRKEAANATRTAFGPDYEARLRAEAGAAPDKKAKRKHQISTLFHHSKMQELEMLEKRGQGMKTKSETQAKYGW